MYKKFIILLQKECLKIMLEISYKKILIKFIPQYGEKIPRKKIEFQKIEIFMQKFIKIVSEVFEKI